MAKVSIYTTPTCHYCKAAKQFFKDHHIAYEEFDVVGNLAKRTEMIERSGQMGVPVIDIDGELTIGYDQSRLEKLLGV